MGWISDRHAKQGGSLNTDPTKQRKGILRKIVGVVVPGTGIFDRPIVKLECGHEVQSSGQYKARCNKCNSTEPNSRDLLGRNRR